MATEKAPVEITGAAGHEFEDSVAGRFLIDLLAGGCSLGSEFGQVTQIRWQVRESGWLGDDLVITCRVGGDERRLALSVKSDRQVTQSGFPSDFVKLAWEQWRGLEGAVATKGTGNGVGLVVGGLAAGVEDAWNKLAVEVRESKADLQRVLDRLRSPSTDDPGSQSSEIERALARSFACPLDGEAQDEPSVESLEVISQVHLLHLDFRSPSSRQETLALADCRKMLASGDEAQTRNLWNELRALAGRKRSSGGTVILAEVLAELRPLFVLRVHPDFDADWRSLDRNSHEALETVSLDIGTVGSVLRPGDIERIRKALLEHQVVALLGPSGVGKSGLAKRIAIEPGTRACWLTADVVDQDSLALVEQRLGINHPFDVALAANPSTCTLVLDALEKFGVRAQERLQQLIRRLLEQNPPHLRLVVTAQLDSVEIVARLMALGVPADRLVQVSVDSPSEDEIRGVLGSHANVHWASLNHAVRPVLRNLKVADWVMSAVEGGAVVNASEVVSISALIDWLWRCSWIQGADDGDERSALMMNLAIKEGASLSAGVPRNSLDQSEQKPLRGLQQSGALFRRHERVFFRHDLLSDWSRLRVLMGEHPQSVASLRDRAANVRWHHALRLYGLWLLEAIADGPAQWGRLASEAERAGDTALRDLLLESVFIASPGAQTLRGLWPTLVVEDGALLKALLERFLYAATVPDPRLTQLGASPAQVAAMSHEYRIPRWEQWPPVLAVLHEKAAEVANFAPVFGARVCNMWLCIAPATAPSGDPFPWRREAAIIAVAIAREIQARHAEGVRFVDTSDKIVFEALLGAAPDLSAEVSALCLRLAQRREPDAATAERAERAKRRGEENRRQWELANPELAARQAVLLTPIFERGPLRDPWSDGPAAKVSESFRAACLDSSAFISLIRTDPEAALEVLLAVCIEEPKHEDLLNATSDEVGLVYWGQGHPPFYSRGPFLRFLQLAPEQGLSFVLRLVNFVTERYVSYLAIAAKRAGNDVSAEDIYLPVAIGEDLYAWYGDGSIFEWHYWSAAHDMVVTVLQAFEKWICDTLDASGDLVPALERVMSESESLAFAGVLVDVGRRHQELFETVLLPLLGVPQLYELDRYAALRRSRDNASELMRWGNEPIANVEAAREWYGANHRKVPLEWLAGEFLQRAPIRDFFDKIRPMWAEAAAGNPPTSWLRLLVERWTPANYVQSTDENGKPFLEFRWPEEVQRAIDEDEPARAPGMLIMQLAMNGRKLIEHGERLEPTARDTLWRLTREVMPSLSENGDENPSAFTKQDAMAAGLAVLFTLHGEWIEEDADRLKWCRDYLESTFSSNGLTYVFGEEAALGNLHADCYVADSGLALLQRDPKDALARRLVARAVTAARPDAIGHLMTRAFAVREQLGDDFRRMQALAIYWAAERRRRDHLAYIRGEPIPRGSSGSEELVEKFVSGHLSPTLPTICELNRTNAAELTEAARQQGQGTGNPELHVEFELRAVDVKVVQAAVAWLRLAAARSSEEKAEWNRLLLDLLTFSLERAPRGEDATSRRFEHSGPQEFDYWVLRLVASNLDALDGASDAQALWASVLELGPGARHWVSTFLSDFLRAAASNSPQEHWLIETWSRMIRYALDLESWGVRNAGDYDLSDAVVALLGFNGAGRQIFQGERGERILAGMLPLFEQAMASWIELPHVARALASSAARLRGGMVVPVLRWLRAALAHDAVRADEELDERLVEFLRACWEEQPLRIQNEPALTKAFQDLMARSNAHGSHAAAVFRDQVLAALAGH